MRVRRIRHPETRTTDSRSSSPRAAPACRSPTTCRPVRTTTTSPAAGDSAPAAWRSRRWPTWRSCWPGCRRRDHTSMTITPRRHDLGDVHRRRREDGVPRAELSGTLQNDILKEFIAQRSTSSHGTVAEAGDRHRRVRTREMPRWNTISIRATHIREPARPPSRSWPSRCRRDRVRGGRDGARAPLRRLRAAPSFFFNSHNDFFEEIAKFRPRGGSVQALPRALRGRERRSTWMRFTLIPPACR